MKTSLSRWLVVGSVVLLPACDWNDPYSDRFALLKLGDPRTKVVAVMRREPHSAGYVDVGGIRVERMVWHARFGATYTVDCVAEHLVIKSAAK